MSADVSTESPIAALLSSGPAHYRNSVIWDLNCNPLQGSEHVPDSASIHILYLVVGIIGMIGNGFTLTVLGFFIEGTKSTTDIMILNQTILDLFGCVSISVVKIMKLAEYRYSTDLPGTILCYLVQTSLTLPTMSSIASLAVIALERYIKVVHSLFHKHQYRQWMLKVLLLIPWLIGLSTSLPLHISTAVVRERQCYALERWTSPALRRVYAVYSVAFLYLTPVIIIIYCYARICLVVGRRFAIVQENIVVTKRVAARRKHKNLVKTLALVSGVFALSWLPIHVFFTLKFLGFRFKASDYILDIVPILPFCSLAANPFLYSVQYDTLRTFLAKLARKGPQTACWMDGSSEVDIREFSRSHLVVRPPQSTVWARPRSP